jgi:Spy/CpxP family protein refolding chaperone
MNAKKVMIAAALAVALPLAALALPGHDGPGGAAWAHQGGPRDEAFEILRGVKLTEAQRTQVHSLMQTAHTQMKPVEQQLRSIHEQIKTALFSTASVDANALKALQEQATTLHAQVDAARLNTAIQVRAVLTPEQLAKAAQMHEQLEALHQQERQILGAPEEHMPQ